MILEFIGALTVLDWLCSDSKKQPVKHNYTRNHEGLRSESRERCLGQIEYYKAQLKWAESLPYPPIKTIAWYKEQIEEYEDELNLASK